MQYHTTKNYFLRFALPGCAMLLALATVGIVNSVATAAAHNTRGGTMHPYFHGNGNGLLMILLHPNNDDNNDDPEGSHEAKDIVIPEFSIAPINLELIIPFNRDLLTTKARSKRTGTIKPYVIRTIKVKVRKP